MNENNAANLIITGPNAGGKTTSLMSLIINVIFAQSFGIAPSAALRLTSFAKIHSYLDITTNLQEGLSLFAAEVDRAKKLKVSILACTPEQKTFTIIDEIFSGTDPKVASEVGFNFAQQLGNMQHSMTIITTHFPALTELAEKTDRYVNYKVADATIHADGSITYPFKLVPGISSQNIASQMLHNQGII
jgi:DNA mismatch repair protein MutS